MTTANETITIEVSTKDLLVRRIQELEATMTKRNATIESLTARIEADGESPLIEAAHVVAVAANGLAEAQVHATLALAEQQRIASKLTVALVDQLSAIAQVSAPASYPVDPSIRIREYLTDDEWAGLGL